MHASVTDAIRCPACGGLNPPSAQWCGQCLTRFEAAGGRAPDPASGSGNPPVIPTSGQTVTQAGEVGGTVPPQTTTADASVRRGPFVVTDGAVQWRCARCDTENPLDRQVCEVCGSTFADTVDPPRERPARDPNTAALYSLFWPGAGHAYIGMWGEAIARGVMSAWVIAVTLVAAIQGSTPGSTLTAIVFGIAAVALWVLAAHDAYREAQGDATGVVLKGRVFVYVVLGLLVLLILSVVTAGMQVGSL